EFENSFENFDADMTDEIEMTDATAAETKTSPAAPRRSVADRVPAEFGSHFAKAKAANYALADLAPRAPPGQPPPLHRDAGCARQKMANCDNPRCDWLERASCARRHWHHDEKTNQTEYCTGDAPCHFTRMLNRAVDDSSADADAKYLSMHYTVYQLPNESADMMADAGCCRSVAGRAWSAAMSERCAKVGLGHAARAASESFGDGDAIRAAIAEVHPDGVCGEVGRLDAADVERDCLGLLGRSALKGPGAEMLTSGGDPRGPRGVTDPAQPIGHAALAIDGRVARGNAPDEFKAKNLHVGHDDQGDIEDDQNQPNQNAWKEFATNLVVGFEVDLPDYRCLPYRTDPRPALEHGIYATANSTKRTLVDRHEYALIRNILDVALRQKLN
ncbi:unnamed protein product, partial [Prorocentrum cordatum]